MSTDQEATNLTIAETAHRLGVSENAIRQRIKRHTLLAVKVNGIWRVTLPDQETDHQATTSTDYYTDQQPDHEGDQEATTTAVSSAARSQLEAIRDEWLRPIMERNEELARQLGRVEQERDQLRVEVDQLRSDQDAARSAPMATGEAEGADVSQEPWWRRMLPWRL